MSVQERIAEALLWSLNVQQGMDEDEANAVVEELLTGLVPLVFRLRAEAAAVELDRMAEVLTKNLDRGPARRCTNRAAVLRSEADR